MKILLLGLDSASFPFIDSMIAEEKLTTLERLNF